MTVVIKRLILFGLLLLCLSGCVPAQTQMPSFFVMLTQQWPDVDHRCSGALLNPLFILTANHCVARAELTRVVTQYGQEVAIVPYKQWPEIDIALYRALLPVYASNYAHMAEANTLEPAEVYGACPFYFSHVPREVVYLHDELIGVLNPQQPCQMWQTLGQQVCGGDSGGIVVQNGNVIGVPVAVESAIFWIPLGTNVCVVPSRLIAERLGR
jgi:hypothetical protein